MKTLIIQYDTPLKPYEVAAFRGAVNQSMEEANELFHNHTDQGVRYAYPLIQYKRIGNKAAIVCINEGLDAAHALLETHNMTLRIGQRTAPFNLDKCSTHEATLGTTDEPVLYKLTNWIPLNSENFQKYNDLSGIIEQFEMLQKILVGNILSFYKSMGYFLEDTVTCTIKHIDSPKTISYKGRKILTFDLVFQTNVMLPEYIGLGKRASHGHGIITNY